MPEKDSKKPTPRVRIKVPPNLKFPMPKIDPKVSGLAELARQRARIARIPLPEPLDPEVFRDHRLADAFSERLAQQISRAEKEAEEGEHLAVYFDTPAGDRILVDEIGFHNPSLIVLYGKSARGNRSRVLVHQESLALVLQYERSEEEPAPKPIGFFIEKTEEVEDE